MPGSEIRVESIDEGRENLPMRDALVAMIDHEFPDHCAREGDDRISPEEVLEASSRIPGSMASAIIIDDERADRS